MKRIKSTLAILLVITLLLGGFAMPVAAQVSDISGHWAEKQISKWVDKEWASGYADGSFRPNNSITRAEFMTLANTAFGFTESLEISFSDVSSSDWYYGEVAKARAAGYVSGYEDGTIRPKNPISRQEAAVMLANISNLNTADSLSALESFADQDSIPGWSKGAIGAVVAEGFMSGYPDGTFKPVRNITRAEAIVMLDNAVSKVAIITYDVEGTYGPEDDVEVIEGNVIISSDGITLQNVVITGDLLIAEEVGDGEVKLVNVTVEGETTVKGGGPNSIELEDCNIPKITVSKDGVRIVASGNTRVRIVTLESGATLVQTTVIGPGFEEVTITEEVPANAKITLAGDFEKVEVEARAEIELTEGSISTLNVTEKAEDATITVASGAKVETMTVDAPVEVKGQGTIAEANVNSTDVKFEKEPEKKNVAPDVGEAEQRDDGRRRGGGGSSGGSTDPGDTTPEEPGPIQVSAISVEPTTMTLTVGATGQITATVKPENATNKKVNWTTSDADVATVDLNGKVTAVAVGTATVTATSAADSTKKASCVVTVVSAGNYIVTVDGISKKASSDSPLYEENGRLWAPLRFIAEALSIEIEWDADILQLHSNREF